MELWIAYRWVKIVQLNSQSPAAIGPLWGQEVAPTHPEIPRGLSAYDYTVCPVDIKISTKKYDLQWFDYRISVFYERNIFKVFKMNKLNSEFIFN